MESTSADDTLRARLNRQYKIEFKAEFNEWIERKQEYNDNLCRVYSIL